MRACVCNRVCVFGANYYIVVALRFLKGKHLVCKHCSVLFSQELLLEKCLYTCFEVFRSLYTVLTLPPLHHIQCYVGLANAFSCKNCEMFPIL